MGTAEQDLASFHLYARGILASGERHLSIDELFDEWRAQNPTDSDYSENVAAIQASIADFQRGEKGSLAGEHSAQLRREFGVQQ